MITDYSVIRSINVEVIKIKMFLKKYVEDGI